MSERPPTKRYHVPAGTWSAERIVDSLRDWAELVGQAPRVLDRCPVERSGTGYRARLWERHYPRWPEASTVVRYFGSWRKGLIAAGLPVDRPPLELPLQERIQAARRMRAQRLSYREIAAELGVYPDVVGQYLRAHLCECGRNYVVVGSRCQECARHRARRHEWTRQEALEAIVRWSEVEGRAPTSSEWQSGGRGSRRWSRQYPSWPTVREVQRLFGSWNQALRAAGFKPVQPIGVTKEDVTAALRDAYRELGDGLSYLRYGTWATANQRPSIAPIVRHFGTFNRARQAAGLPC